MNNKLFVIFVFWWSVIFPSLSFNSITTDIKNSDIKYYDLFSRDFRKEILKNAEYDLWIKTTLFSNE